MRSARIHFPSLFAGAGAIALVLGLVSMMQAPTHLPPFQIQGIPTPQQMMRVVEGQPFTVPTGCGFVVSAVGKTDPTGWSGQGAEVSVFFTGQPVLKTSFGGGPIDIPPGLVAEEGATVSVDATSTGFDPTGVVLGYMCGTQTHGATAVVKGIPTASQMHRVVEGQQFVVPDGKSFVATGVVWTTTLGDNVEIRFDGQAVLTTREGGSIPEEARHIAPGIVAQGGTAVEVITVGGSGHTAVLLGYLADA